MVRAQEGWTPLHFAAWEGHQEAVALLVRLEADTNATTTKVIITVMIARSLFVTYRAGTPVWTDSATPRC
jgi:ankyrin repeat protein